MHSTDNTLNIPEPSPARKVPGYQMPETCENLLAWDFVADRMSTSEFYWINTVYPDGRPHSVPLWGIWYEERFHCDGSTETAWSQNLTKNPRISVHTPDPNRVVIVHGIARFLEDDDLDEASWDRLDTAYQTKYQVDTGSPWIRVEPTKVLAWNGGELTTMTRWLFQ